MGFLSRKPKPAPIQVDEQHPIVEELQRMEEAVPERSGVDTWEGEEVDDFAYEYEEASDESGSEGPHRTARPL